MMPDFRAGNAYQRLLAEGLDLCGWHVVFPSGTRRGLPLARAVLDEKPEVLHLHWIHPYLGEAGRLPSIIYGLKLILDVYCVRALGVRLVWTIHNIVAHECRFVGWQLWVRRCVARAANTLIVHSDAAAKRVSRAYRLPQSRFKVIGHGGYRKAYGPAVSRKSARRQLHLPLDRRIILHFGQIRAYKNLRQVIDWWRSAQIDASELHIVGDCASREMATQVELWSQESGVMWHRGFLPDDKVAQWICAADELVCAGTHLTSGVEILAASYERPATRLGQPIELLYPPEWDVVAEQTIAHYERR